MATKETARMVLRGVGVYVALILMITVIIWDLVSIAIPPPSVEWALLFTIANAALLVSGWAAFYHWPRRVRA